MDFKDLDLTSYGFIEIEKSKLSDANIFEFKEFIYYKDKDDNWRFFARIMESELKTLKDIDLNIDDIRDINKPDTVEALKIEAIKWAKHIYNKADGNLGLYAWIIRFFNLTAENLILGERNDND